MKVITRSATGFRVTRSAAAAWRHRQMGVSLIEVLVAVVVLSIGLLGLAGLQASGMRVGQSSFYRGQAALMAYDMVDRIRANSAGAKAGKYDRALSAADETDTNRALTDINDWMARVRILPGGQGAISISGAVATVSIVWNDQRGTVRGATDYSNAAAQRFDLQAQVWNNN
jgi:type IV pilus assembly protein PilV